jgi:hypothetical protein
VGNAAQTDMVQLDVRLDHISTSKFAAMLGRTHEYARRLIAGSKCGKKNGSGYWLIPRSWAEKFVRLHKRFRQAENRQHPLHQDYEERDSGDLSIVHADGSREGFRLNEHDLDVLVATFGLLPLVLDREDASVLRATTAYRNHPNPEATQALDMFCRKGLDLESAKRLETYTKRKSLWWNEKLADLIERTGRIEVSAESSVGVREPLELRREPIEGFARHGNKVKTFDEANRKAAEEQADIEELLKQFKLREAAK